MLDLIQIKLTKEQFRKLRERILSRDKFKCRKCGRQDGLECHHIIKRSKKRLDVDWNLIMVCQKCHRELEDRIIIVQQEDNYQIDCQIDANKKVRWFRID
jgi:5-methylcytosine-specific restriction endonuclease McrA